MRRLKIVCLIVTMARAAACAETGSPAAPSALAPAGAGHPGSSSGGTITGTVQSGLGALALRTDVVAPGLTVQVVGTNLSATAGPFGQFTLNGVPAGNVELRFSGPGVDAKITITQVENGEIITVAVRVSGTTAVVKSEERSGSGNGETRINGVVDQLSGTAFSFEFFIGTRRIHGSNLTQFFGEGPNVQGFANLRNGRRVEVKGTPGNTFIIANRIHINGEDHEDEVEDREHEAEGRKHEEDEAEFTGRITAITGTDLTLNVGGTMELVHTTGAVIRRRGNVVAFNALAMRQVVEVEGTRRPDRSVDAKKITIEDENLPEVQLRGTISELNSTASCPSITFRVSGSPIVTNSATEFDDVRCRDLKNTDRVRVDGVRENGNIRAKRVRRDD